MIQNSADNIKCEVESHSGLLYRIRDWDKHFEVSQSKRAPKTLSWVAVPNKHDGKSFRRLIRRPNGVELYGAWQLIVQVASKCQVRGTLADKDGPLTAADISDKTGASETIISEALQVLSSPEIKWIERVGLSESTPSALRENSEHSPSTGQDKTGQDRTEQKETGCVAPAVNQRPVETSRAETAGTAAASPPAAKIGVEQQRPGRAKAEVKPIAANSSWPLIALALRNNSVPENDVRRVLNWGLKKFQNLNGVDGARLILAWWLQAERENFDDCVAGVIAFVEKKTAPERRRAAPDDDLMRQAAKMAREAEPVATSDDERGISARALMTELISGFGKVTPRGQLAEMAVGGAAS